MQKQPFGIDEHRYDHISLPDDFPVAFGDRYSLEDRKISYLHYHKFPELGICHEGSGVFILDTSPSAFSQGDVTYIPGGRYHLARSTTGVKTTWSYITFDPERLFGALPENSPTKTLLRMLEDGSPLIIKENDTETGLQIFQDLIFELRHKEFGWQDSVESSLQNIIVKVGRLSRSGELHEKGLDQLSYTKLLPAFEYITLNYQEEIDSEYLAEISYVSVTHLRRLFRKITGLSPLQYLNQIRVEAASRLLVSTDMTFISIALDTGFTSLSSFNRQFKALTGGTPFQWKRDHRY